MRQKKAPPAFSPEKSAKRPAAGGKAITRRRSSHLPEENTAAAIVGDGKEKFAANFGRAPFPGETAAEYVVFLQEALRKRTEAPHTVQAEYDKIYTLSDVETITGNMIRQLLKEAQETITDTTEFFIFASHATSIVKNHVNTYLRNSQSPPPDDDPSIKGA